jgi:hypothetical protein
MENEIDFYNYIGAKMKDVMDAIEDLGMIAHIAQKDGESYPCKPFHPKRVNLIVVNDKVQELYRG